jgi:hypothetical protein
VNDRAGWLASFAGGTLLWSVATMSSGGREPWDTGEYWAIYMPLACALSGLLGFAFPTRTWRWALAVMLAQMPVMWVAHGVGSLWIPGVIMLLVLALPGMLVAALGGLLRRSRKAA